MNIYTYIVEHGMDNPRVSLNTEINGGKLIVVAFDDYAKRIEELENLIAELRMETSINRVHYAIDDYIN